MKIRTANIVAISLFSTYPLAGVLDAIGKQFGCNNAFEQGCTGIGNVFGSLASLLGIASLITYPLGIVFLVIASRIQAKTKSVQK